MTTVLFCLKYLAIGLAVWGGLAVICALWVAAAIRLGQRDDRPSDQERRSA